MACGITGKARACPNARYGGRSRRSDLGIRAPDTTTRVVCGVYSPGRSLWRGVSAWAVLREYVSPRWRKRGVILFCETGYGVSFAHPDCTRIEEGIVWAKPDLVRTESSCPSFRGPRTQNKGGRTPVGNYTNRPIPLCFLHERQSFGSPVE